MTGQLDLYDDVGWHEWFLALPLDPSKPRVAADDQEPAVLEEVAALVAEQVLTPSPKGAAA